jgi:hypothetical protein
VFETASAPIITVDADAALTDPDAPDGSFSEVDRGEEAGPNNTAV